MYRSVGRRRGLTSVHALHVFAIEARRIEGWTCRQPRSRLQNSWLTHDVGWSADSVAIGRHARNLRSRLRVSWRHEGWHSVGGSLWWRERGRKHARSPLPRLLDWEGWRETGRVRSQHWNSRVWGEQWDLLRLIVVGMIVGALSGRRHEVLVMNVSEGTLLFTR